MVLEDLGLLVHQIVWVSVCMALNLHNYTVLWYALHNENITGSVATYQCNTGFSLSACNGSWFGDMPNCYTLQWFVKVAIFSFFECLF